MTSRKAILDSALTLFCARGYDAVGVQEIVEAAGVYQTQSLSLLWQQEWFAGNIDIRAFC
jgi:hypothetical protein